MRFNTMLTALTVVLLGLSLFACNSKPTDNSVTPTNISPSITPNTFQKWTLRQVVDAFKSAGLEVGEVRENDVADIYGAPTTALEFASFNIPSRGEDAGGLIFVFSSEADMQSVYNYYKEAGWYDNGLYYPWVFIKDNILLQINGILGKSMAQKYGEALDNLK